MNPSVDDRINSAIRALSHVVLPALPEDAALAREQIMLVMGQVQIIQAQMDAAPAYEAEEAADFRAMADAVLPLANGGTKTAKAKAALQAALADQNADAKSREQTSAIQRAIDTLLIAVHEDGDDGVESRISNELLPMTAKRAAKDRAWFAAMGFDAEFS